MRNQTKVLIKRSLAELVHWRPKLINQNRDAPYQVVDFFCGAGGMSAGFAALGQANGAFRLIGGCDIDPDALTTYRQNFNTVAIQRDIRDLARSGSELARLIEELDGRDQSKPLIVIGCAPCQGFTSHRKKRWNEEDERNNLMGAFASVAVKLKPVCIVMENVPEMLSEKYWDYFMRAKRKFEAAGYIVQQGIFNAAFFGVPQERFRSLVLAMRKEFVLPEAILTQNEFLTVRDAIGDLVSVSPGVADPHDSMHRSASHRQSTIDTIKAVPKNGGSRPPGVGPKCLDKVKGFYDVYGRLHWDRPAITITHYARNPASGRFVHPEQDRGLTMREAALLQSFPRGFSFSGGFDSVFKQIGEAVPPKFACAVAATIYVELNAPQLKAAERSKSVPSIATPVSNSYSSVIAGLKKRRKKDDLQLR